MRKNLIIAIAIVTGVMASSALAQTFAGRSGNLVLAGSGGTDLSSTLTIKTASPYSGNHTLTFPNSNGASGYALTTDGTANGILTWTQVVTGSGTASGTNTGDVTLNGPGSYLSLTGQQINQALITYANMQQTSAASVLLGRNSGGAGAIQEITLGSGLTMSALGVLSATATGTISGLTTNGAVYASGATSVASTAAMTDGTLLIGKTGVAPVLASLTGTASRLLVTNGAGSITLNIDPTYAGQNTITTLGTIGTGIWQGTVIAPQYGGTGLNTSATPQGTMFYIDPAGTWATLAKSTTATRYISNTGTSNDPAWAQVDLTNGVTGLLPPANGGTGANNGTNTLTINGGNITFTSANPSNVTLPASGVLATTGNSVLYNQTSTENTATVAATNYLYDISYGATAAAQNALGARINSTNTSAGANNNATGLTITTAATTGGTANGLVLSTTGGTTDIDITTPTTNGATFTIQPGAGTAATNNGTNVAITGGTGNTTGTGGNITVKGGTGGATNATGGQVTIAGGASGTAAGTGGAIELQTASTGTGTTLTNRVLVDAAGNTTLQTAGAQLIFTGSSGNSTFAAGGQSANVFNYTLPTTVPIAGQVLTASTVSGASPYAITFGWSNGGGGGGGVTYNTTATQNTATVAATNYLYDISYAATAAAQNALGARINSTNTSAGANNNATGLTITSVATTGGTSTGLTVSATGGTTQYAATFTNGNVGIGNAAPTVGLDVSKDFSTREFTYTTSFASGSTTNNFNVDGANNQFAFTRFTTAAGPFTIGGFLGGQNGKRMTIFNNTGQTMTLANQTGGAAANQIFTGTGASISIPNGGMADLIYENVGTGTLNNWIVKSTSNGNSSSPVLFARKTANVSLTASNLNLQADPDLQLALQANATYEFSGVIVYNGAAASSDLKLGISFSGTVTSLRWSAMEGGVALAPSTVTTAATNGSVGTVGTDIISPFTADGTFANELSIYVSGVIQVGGTGGTLQMQESQVTSQATQTTIRLNSTLKATRVQ
jgi:hypothetical protein